MVATLLDKNGTVWVYGDGNFCNGVYDDDTPVYTKRTKLDVNTKIIKCASIETYRLMLDEDGNVWGFGPNPGCFPTSAKRVNIVTKFWNDGGIVDVCIGHLGSALLDISGCVWICAKRLDCDIFTKVINVPSINKMVAHGDCIYLKDNESTWWYLGKSYLDNSNIFSLIPRRLNFDFDVVDISMGDSGSNNIIIIDDKNNIYGCGSDFGKNICLPDIEVNNKLQYINNFIAIKAITIGDSTYILDIEGNLWIYGLVNDMFGRDRVNEWVKINQTYIIDILGFDGSYIVMIDKKGRAWIHGMLDEGIFSTATKIYMYKNLGCFSLECYNIKSARNR